MRLSFKNMQLIINGKIPDRDMLLKIENNKGRNLLMKKMIRYINLE